MEGPYAPRERQKGTPQRNVLVKGRSNPVTAARGGEPQLLQQLAAEIQARLPRSLQLLGVLFVRPRTSGGRAPPGEIRGRLADDLVWEPKLLQGSGLAENAVT